MTEYRREDLLRLARRHHNTKRTYLLVNPLQGKHIPVSPTASLKMLRTLGQRAAEAYPDTGLVIGFAETATAVGAAVAECLRCSYIHTTREPQAVNGAAVLSFQEEHSHATDQFLCTEGLADRIAAAKGIAFVDDEISTGKTLLNIIREMKRTFPQLQGKGIAAVSIINRLTDERIDALKDEGVSCLSLLHLPFDDYTEAVRHFDIRGAEPPAVCRTGPSERVSVSLSQAPRRVVAWQDYSKEVRENAERILAEIRPEIRGKRVTILGTEEFMYGGLVLGEMLEREEPSTVVDFHATTRSPIGICDEKDYPITSGWQLHSFYETDRVTYIYDLRPCDVAVIVTDSQDDDALRTAAEDIQRALASVGCRRVILVQEKQYVQHL